MEKRVTIKDVAADVGVSISVVSYVLNDCKKVSISEQTRKKVLASAKKLGYVQNKNASILRSGKSYTLGVVSYWADSDSYSSFINGIKTAADNEGYKILIYSATKNTDIDDFLSYYRDHMIDGIIILAPYEKYDKYDLVKYVKVMNEQKINFAIINANSNNVNGCIIPVEYTRCVYNATKYFIEKGYKEITYVDDINYTNNSMQERYNAYFSIMREYGMEPNVCRVNEIKDKIHTFKAVVASKSFTAHKVLTAALDMGYKIPDDFEIIAANTEVYSRYLYPPLSTVKVPAKDIGEFAAKSVIKQINGKVPSNYLSQNFEYRIELRESTRSN